MLLWFIGLVGSLVGEGTALASALNYVGLIDHYNNFGQGIIDSRDLIYFVSLTLGSLYLATRIVETRRWR
jgi:ABC-2 type transport system permease protein